MYCQCPSCYPYYGFNPYYHPHPLFYPPPTAPISTAPVSPVYPVEN